MCHVELHQQTSKAQPVLTLLETSLVALQGIHAKMWVREKRKEKIYPTKTKGSRYTNCASG